MALLSDIDWVILLVVAAFLLFGRENGAILRQIGRWYGRAARLKQELLGELTKAAELPPAGAPTSLRALLLDSGSWTISRTEIPLAVSTPPSPAIPPPVAPSGVSLPSPLGTWTVALPSPSEERETLG